MAETVATEPETTVLADEPEAAPEPWCFPPTPEASPIREAVWAAGTGLLVALVAAVRVPGMFDSLWAEDANVYLSQAFEHPLRETVFLPYAGYWQLVPRLLATPATWGPASLAAVVVSLGSLAAVAAAGALAEAGSGAYVRRRWLRVGLALPLALLPVLADEVLGALANTNWITPYGCFWALLWVPRSRWAQAAAAAALVLTALSTPLAAMLVPLALLRLAWRRPGRWVPALYLAATAGYALAVRRLDDRAPAPGTPLDRLTETAGWFREGVLANFRPGAPFGDLLNVQSPATVLPDQGPLLTILLVVALGALAVGVARPPFDLRRGFAIGAAVATAALAWGLVLTVAGPAGRYAVAPALLLAATALVLVDGGLDRLPARVGWPAAAVVVGTLGLAAAVAFPAVDSRDGSVAQAHWKTGVANAWARCQAAPDGAELVPALPEGWVARIPCRHLIR